MFPKYHFCKVALLDRDISSSKRLCPHHVPTIFLNDPVTVASNTPETLHQKSSISQRNKLSFVDNKSSTSVYIHIPKTSSYVETIM